MENFDTNLQFEHECNDCRNTENRLRSANSDIAKMLTDINAALSRQRGLEKENERLKIELSNYAYQIDSAKRDRDKLEKENQELREDSEREADELAAQKDHYFNLCDQAKEALQIVFSSFLKDELQDQIGEDYGVVYTAFNDLQNERAWR
jgi:septal ring factor EnvC (AmiA/AmiB activator)